MAEILSTYDNTTTANVQEGKIFLKNYKSTGTAGSTALDNTLSLTDDGISVSGQAGNIFNVGYTEASSNTTTGALVVAGGAGIVGKVHVGDDFTANGQIKSAELFPEVRIEASNAVSAYSGGVFAKLRFSSLTDGTLAIVGPRRVNNGEQQNLVIETYTNGSMTGDIEFENADAGTSLAYIHGDLSAFEIGSQKLKIGDTANTGATSVIEGSGTLWIDPSPVEGDANGTVIIKGDLQVDGTTTTLNSTTLTVDDLNIVVKFYWLFITLGSISYLGCHGWFKYG